MVLRSVATVLMGAESKDGQEDEELKPSIFQWMILDSTAARERMVSWYHFILGERQLVVIIERGVKSCGGWKDSRQRRRS
jgi:hypothetical protein